MKAFPYNREIPSDKEGYKAFASEDGLDLRDYFAAKAIPALITGGMHTNVWELSRDAYKIADAMMEVRKEGNE
jgi:hypothetical protein